MNKTAIVTGGGRGLGYAIARQLLGEGFNVIIMDVHESAKIKDNLDLLQGSFLYARGDITNPEDRQRCLDTALGAYGRVDVLINNAGVGPLVRNDLLEMTEESFDRVLSINLKGTMFLTQLVAKQMIKQEVEGHRRGAIVNIASVSSDVPSVNRGEYCISKAGVSMLTRLYAARLAGEAVFVYEVRPGIIETELTAVVKDKYDALFEQGICPIRRWGQPEDVAKAVSLLASDYLPYSTGEIINVDGGFHIQRL